MVVDDSAVMRQVMTGMLAATPGMEVLCAVADPLLAMERMKHHWPDVIVLDVEMPRMDGITFLRKIMQERPTPVVICSTLTDKGARTTMDALAAGAFSVIAKPKLGLKQFLFDSSEDLVATVKAAALAKAGQLAMPVPPKLSADVILAPGAGPAAGGNGARIVAIGTSTGGTQALQAVLTALPEGAPGIVIVQHMPANFTAAFADRLDGLCRIGVREARHHEPVRPGQALIAPGGKHLLVRADGAGYRVEVVDGPLVNRHRPSVDVLFRSLARCAGANALGIIMTGMGDDGAAGLLEMRRAGAHTVAQDEASCAVYGMPKEALRLDAVERVVPLGRIAAAICGQCADAM